VDDPYEAPVNPEVRIDTSTMTPNQSVKNVLFFLSEKDYI
jgi:sulfate adenylyltransferase